MTVTVKTAWMLEPSAVNAFVAWIVAVPAEAGWIANPAGTRPPAEAAGATVETSDDAGVDGGIGGNAGAGTGTGCEIPAAAHSCRRARHSDRRAAPPPPRGGAPLADRVAAEAQHYRRVAVAGGMPTLDRDTAATVADALERLAQLVALARASTAQEFADRFAAMEDDRDQTHERHAYAQGYDHGRREGRDLAFQEITTVLRRSAGIR